MAPKIFLVFLMQGLIFKVYASQVQPTIHYIISSPQPSTAQTVVPTPPKPSNSLSSLASLASLLTSGIPTSAPSGIPTSLASLISAVPTKTATVVPTKAIAAPAPPEKPSSNSVDTELLNNLAIALQLMIVNNILSSPQPESPSTNTPNTPNSQNSETVSTFPSLESFDLPLSYAPIQNDLPPIVAQYQPYQPHAIDHSHSQFNQMPNANYVGSSGFGNPFMGTVPPPMPSRSGLTLMSPYEALSPSSPYMDPILSSPYGSVMTSKHDFQSPYASILGSDNKDYFSMSSINDLF